MFKQRRVRVFHIILFSKTLEVDTKFFLCLSLSLFRLNQKDLVYPEFKLAFFKATLTYGSLDILTYLYSCIPHLSILVKKQPLMLSLENAQIIQQSSQETPFLENRAKMIRCNISCYIIIQFLCTDHTYNRMISFVYVDPWMSTNALL